MMADGTHLVYRGGKGAHDDLVLAAIALWGSAQRPSYTTSHNYLGKSDVPPHGTGVRPYGPRAGR